MVGDVLRDAHMQSRCVTQLTIVTFRPQVRIAGSMDELDSDPSPLAGDHDRSEEHTSELQSPRNLVCRLLLEKKKNRAFLSRTKSPKILYSCSTDMPALHRPPGSRRLTRCTSLSISCHPPFQCCAQHPRTLQI